MTREIVEWKRPSKYLLNYVPEWGGPITCPACGNISLFPRLGTKLECIECNYEHDDKDGDRFSVYEEKIRGFWQLCNKLEV